MCDIKRYDGETEEELADFGMLFGLFAPEEKLAEKIRREPAYEIFENIEKAREKMSVLWKHMVVKPLILSEKHGYEKKFYL